MSDHFDITLERKLESKPDEADGGVSKPRRIELITGTGRRRRWSSDDKARIVVESLVPGAIVSEVARRNGLSPQQLFAWRREAYALFTGGADTHTAVQVIPISPPPQRVGRQAQSPTSANAPAFAPVAIVAASPASPPPSQPPVVCSGTIEITIGDAVVRIIGQVETSMLTTVLRAVRRAS